MRSYHAHYALTGFYSPLTNTSALRLNVVHVGDLIQLSFGLAGDRGLEVFADGSSSSAPISCPARTSTRSKAAAARIDGGRSARRLATTAWAGRPGWAGTCRR